MGIKVEGICPHYKNEGLVITYFENNQQIQSIYKPTRNESLHMIQYLSSILLEEDRKEWDDYNEEMNETYPENHGESYCLNCGQNTDICQGNCDPR